MKLLQAGETQLLRKKAALVKSFDQNLKKTIAEMKKTLLGTNGVGLAANQVGVDLSLFIAKPKNKFYVFINPVIEVFGEPVLMEEGCLSLSGKWGYLERYPEVKINYQDVWGKKKTLRAKGLLAQIIQHEVDHLNGLLFIDKAKEVFDISKNKQSK
jgi:peptide deformylase